MQGTLTVDALELDVGDHEIVLRDVRDDIDGSISGDLRAGVAELNHRLLRERVSQDLLAPYRLGDVALDLKARRDGDGVVHIPQLALTNRVGGTTLSLRGGLDAGAERRSLSLKGELTQDLSRCGPCPGSCRAAAAPRCTCASTAATCASITRSPRCASAGATIKLPRAGVSIESMDGEIPLTADLVARRRRHAPFALDAINTYSELRFADQHPLLSRPSFISIARADHAAGRPSPRWPATCASTTTSSRSASSRCGVRGGRVTGQCLLDWRRGRHHGAAARARQRRRAPRTASRFDGNAALVLSTRERSVDGRAEILRIGKRHLLDLLDLHDPHHADAAVNRIRRALALGYPDHVRLSFNHGFADVKITFGGLARLVSVDELRGIPMGPVIDKLLAPLARKQEDEE